METYNVDVFDYKGYVNGESSENNQLEGPAKVIDEMIIHDMEHTLAKLMTDYSKC